MTEASGPVAPGEGGAPERTPVGKEAAPGQEATQHGPAGQEAAPGQEAAQQEGGTKAPDGAGREPDGQRLHGCPVSVIHGATVVHCNRDQYLGLARALREDGFEMPIGVTAVDYLTHPGRPLPDGIRAERFEVVVELLSLEHHRRVRIRCQVPAEDPRVPSLFSIWPGTEFHERETYDMFGIVFEGHPDLSRILMPEDWEGHPLRKDYPTGHVPVQFKEAQSG